MEPWVLLLGLVAVLVAAGWGFFSLARRLRELKAAQGHPDQAMLLLQQEIASVRSEARQVQGETLGALRQELHQFAGQVAQQLGQVGGGVTQQLQNITAVVGRVQESLGKVGEATQRVFDVGKDIAGLEQILRSPKVRGGLGETMLENLLAQMLPREHYALQHAFSTGDRVDAAIRIGDRLVPVDAKFPLENFRRMLEETEDDRRRQIRRAFIRDVKGRVDEVAKKYILPDEGTFDFALMYVPAENVYYEIILKEEAGEEESLAAYALGRRVIPVSPNSLYAYLRVIVLGLRGLQIERNALEIQARLTRLRGDLDRFREAFEVTGKHLTNAKNKYEEAAGALARFEAKLEGVEGRGEQPALPGLQEP